MKLVTSRRLNRPFYITPEEHPPIDGIPCFSLEEIELLKELDPSDAELRNLFDSKAILGATVESVTPPKIEPLKDKYAKKKPNPSPHLETIRKIIENSKIRGS